MQPASACWCVHKVFVTAASPRCYIFFFVASVFVIIRVHTAVSPLQWLPLLLDSLMWMVGWQSSALFLVMAEMRRLLFRTVIFYDFL